MSTLSIAGGADATEAVRWRVPSAGVLATAGGIVVLAIPVLLDLARQEWATDQGSLGPILLALGLWLLVREWPAPPADARPAPGKAVLALLPILLLYLSCRVTGQVWLAWMSVVAAGVVAVVDRQGWPAARKLWFAILFLALLAPPPGLVSGALIDWLNPRLAEAAVALFRWTGTDAASSGTILYVGAYEMQMTDACAGMGSLLSLFAVGMLYVRLRQGNGWRYAVLLAPAIAGIAVLANLGRVLLLMLVTVELGDRAAQGWFHPMAGLILFSLALAALVGLDALLAPLRDKLAGRAAR